ncbi:hypothetical protein Tco_0613372 [Tanacetum coccineum]
MSGDDVNTIELISSKIPFKLLEKQGRGNGLPQRQPFQQHNYGGEDSNVENEYEDEREVRGMRFGHRGAADFDYRQ